MSLTAPEVTRLGSDLQKASAAEPDAVLKILTQLRKDVTASEDLLRTTKIGITVNKFKTHKDPQIARAAGEVVAKWRRDVKSGAATAGKGGGASPAESGKSTPVGGTPVKEGGGAGNGANGNGSGSGSFKVNVPLEKRSSVTDKIDTDRTGNKIRDSCLKLMYDGLANMSEERESPIVLLSRDRSLTHYTTTSNPPTNPHPPTTQHQAQSCPSQPPSNPPPTPPTPPKQATPTSKNYARSSKTSKTSPTPSSVYASSPATSRPSDSCA